MEIKKINDYEWEIQKSNDMNVPVRVFASKKLLESMKQDKTLIQASNIAKLPSIFKYVVVLPDGHQGYGANIGSTSAFVKENGIISPGMTGFDINCGVRLVSTNISVSDFLKKRKEIIHDFKRTIPSGVGRGGKRYTKEEIKQVLVKGSAWALENNMAEKQDLQKTEENGQMKNANPDDVSERALCRGLPQLGTLGAGNHFIDIFSVEEIFDEEVAQVFGINKDNVLFMIHCGSRGLGHQVASDYMRLIEQEYGVEKFPDRELGYAPFNSELGKKYFSAMKCAVNFAFCNRQIIMYYLRQVLKRHFSDSQTNLVYDVAHNITKLEKYNVEGVQKELIIVRKGATRSFGGDRDEIPNVYKKVGQPVLIPGSMSTPSFVLVGTKEAENKSFASSCHGAGRAHSRTWAHKELTFEKIKKILKDKDIELEGSFKGTIEETELAYKNVEEVIDVTIKNNLAKKVVKLKPLAVMIG
jgi:tRNA-splicing ligase RtcB